MAAFSSGLLAVYIEDKFQNIIRPFIGLLAGSIVSTVLWSIFIKNVVAAYILSGLVGFFVFSYLGLSIRVAVVYNERISETLPTVVFYLICQIITVGYIEAILFVKVYEISRIWLLTILTFINSVGLILVLLKFDKKRFSVIHDMHVFTN